MALQSITTENTEFTEKSTEDSVLEYHDLGAIHIETAIDLYHKKNYLCSITLAGAADSSLSSAIKYLNENSSTKLGNALDMLKETISRNYDVKKEDIPNPNLIRNALKHFVEEACDREHNIKADAEVSICRAIYNFDEITQNLTKNMAAFITMINECDENSVVRKKETDLNAISGKIVDCAIQVHKKLGPGLLESSYQHALAYMLTQNNIAFQKEKTIPIHMDNLNIDAGYRADFIVEDTIILEIKSVEKLIPIHDSQILTYMRLGHFPLGLLLNFNEQLLKNGIKRFKL